MASKKTKTNPEVNGVPAAADAATTDVVATDVAVADTNLRWSSLPVASSVGHVTKKKAKKATTPKGRMPKTTKADTPQTTEDKPRRLSALDAAAKVLQESGKPLNCQEMIQAMAAKGYWTSPAGKTPASTLYSALMREIKIKGQQARFHKTERGHFAYQAPQAS
jgi:HB1, ASXL, restriction endonuclease HTH domain